MNINDLRLEVLRYQRAFRFTVDALHTLCCASGGMRERLQKIDLEFYTLRLDELPKSNELRAKFCKLHELVTSKESNYQNEGRVAATLAQLHHTKLKIIAELIWEIHKEFCSFMLHDEKLTPPSA